MNLEQKSKELLDTVKAAESPLNVLWWRDKLMELSALNPKLKAQMFRFVDLLPNLEDRKERVNKLKEYIAEAEPALASILSAVTMIPGATSILAKAVKMAVGFLAQTFIVGSNFDEAIANIKILEAKGQTYTLDVLGELAVSEEESQEYLDEYISLLQNIPHANISVKLSALDSQVTVAAFELSKERLKTKLRKIYRVAIENSAEVNVDLEHFETKDLYNTVVRETLMEEEFRHWDKAAVVLQAYLRSSKADLLEWLSWAKARGTKIKIRLVKGAYWDYEVAIADQHGWPAPVYTIKAESDVNYEELTEILFKNSKYLIPAIASHNLRSLANAMLIAEKYQVSKDDFEMQMLYGMMEGLKDDLCKKGYCVRSYLPYGELIPGMSYLVRRLLENTANESFLRTSNLKDPKIILAEEKEKQKNNKSNFVNEANLDFSIAINRNNLSSAIERQKHQLKEENQYPLVIAGERIITAKQEPSVNPSDYKQVLGMVSYANKDQTNSAIDAASEAFKFWSKTDPAQRIAAMREAAKIVQRRRNYFSSLLVLEVAKPWQEADAEVSELIDFFNYYAEQAEELYGEEQLISKKGESNKSSYMALGVTGVIAPWNFPLAISGGMIAASLLTGNTVIFKPSEQSSIVGYELYCLLEQVLLDYFGSAAKAVLNYVPGLGEVVGETLVTNPVVKMIAFTGSSEVGLGINKKLSADTSHVRYLSAETGGKNAIIIDDTADLDEAVPAVISSAFAFAGQKCSACSRVLVTPNIYEHFVDRLKESTKSMYIGAAENPETLVSSLIDKDAQKKAQRYFDIGKREAKALVSDLEIPPCGFFVSPSVFVDVAVDAKIATDEIFAPLLAVVSVADLDHAISVANSSPYGLTAALFSRSPLNIKQTSSEIEVGNFYINRSCTGAIVGRQAFGGVKRSSIGFKAGGPNYLKQFCKEKTITENTMRRGFVVD